LEIPRVVTIPVEFLRDLSVTSTHIDADHLPNLLSGQE
jgi:hypothetical protein